MRRKTGRIVVGYGAPAKAVTLLSYCGVGADLLHFTVDRSPHKQGPAVAGLALADLRARSDKRGEVGLHPIFPWNIKDAIMRSAFYARSWVPSSSCQYRR